MRTVRLRFRLGVGNGLHDEATLCFEFIIFNIINALFYYSSCLWVYEHFKFFIDFVKVEISQCVLGFFHVKISSTMCKIPETHL